MRERIPEKGAEMADQFDKWLSDTLPEAHEDPMEGRIHLAILRDRMRRTRRRRNLGRFAAVAVPVVALVMFMGGVGNLGSDDFELDRRVSEDGSTEALVQGMQETGFQMKPGEDSSEIEDMAQQLAAGETNIREVQGWHLDGATYWSLTLVYDVDGQEEIRHADPVYTPSELTPGIGQFLFLEWEGFRKRIEAGEIAARETGTTVLDGVECTVRTYVLQSEESGEVVYYLGGPTP